ncbi:sugar transferase [Campylobacter ureolyticus]|uniref:sugar transferase n=1 Tax=Campylobacter ureolyticus TaxID=827 RepID=UPI0022B35D90|nr:sugar transferase [Campylobacter ureolyticus]MCZ6105406.1 sugar transferase [Campylobacter ureolyticus]MCZ6158356.1 sugar transferase [Campylobacter ureolyticus]
MIVLGDKYKFNEIELKKLKKKFKNIEFLEYDGSRKSSVLIRKKIKELLKKDYYKYLVLNTDFTLDSKIIRFLTLLQFKYHKRSLKIVSIQKFLEKNLCKIYIPDDSKNLNFLSEIRPYNKFEFLIKRVIDIIGALILWVINLAIKPYIKKKIKEQSPGKIYFIQKRVGINMHEFGCCKFRTMHENSEFAKYTKKNDNRVFPFGKFMRKTRIDELPQYINVLKGDMHLIGPRAEWNILVSEYEKEIPYYNERHLVRPGITGWAQVNYPYGENIYDTKQKLMYDLYYIKHWSLWLEIKVVFKTIGIVLGRKGI